IGRLRVLNGELHVIEAAVGKAFQPRAAQQHAGGGEGGIEAGLGSGGGGLLQVTPHGWVAAGGMELQDAEARGLGPGGLPAGGGGRRTSCQAAVSSSSATPSSASGLEQ